MCLVCACVCLVCVCVCVSECVCVMWAREMEGMESEEKNSWRRQYGEKHLGMCLERRKLTEL